MKKGIALFAAASLCAALLAGCGATATASSAASEAASEVTSAVSEAASEVESAVSDAVSEVADSALLDSAVAAIEAINEVPNPRVIDDFSLENEMGLNPDNIVAFKGNVTNDQADCALVFVAQVKEGTADTVVNELKAYQDTMTGNLYAEFADKVAKAADARIVSNGNYVAMVISGINGPDYSAIDAVLNSALAG